MAASLLSMVVMAAPQAGAVGGTVCASSSGTATFTPPLPALGSKSTVLGNLTAIGTLGKCVGGGVTSAHTKFVSVKGTTGSNCTTLLTYNPKAKPTTGTETITWNTGKTSTAALSLGQIKGKATEAKITAKITAGLFKGSTQTGTVSYKAVPATGCTKTPLVKVSYVGVGPGPIK